MHNHSISCTHTVIIVHIILNFRVAISSKLPSVPVGDDKSNWQALWRVLKASGSTKSEKEGLTVLDTIIHTNARQRGKFHPLYIESVGNWDTLIPYNCY